MSSEFRNSSYYSLQVGRNIAELRIIQGWTLNQLVERVRNAGVSFTYYQLSCIERGTPYTQGGYPSLSVDQLMAFARVFGVPSNCLLTKLTEQDKVCLPKYGNEKVWISPSKNFYSTIMSRNTLQLRKSRNLTQGQTARKVQLLDVRLSEQLLSRIERIHKTGSLFSVRVDQLMALAIVFNVSPMRLLDESGHKK